MSIDALFCDLWNQLPNLPGETWDWPISQWDAFCGPGILAMYWELFYLLFGP